MKNRIQLLKKFVCAAGIVLLTAGGANAGIIFNIDDIDPTGDPSNITVTGDYDGGGSTDTLTFTLTRTFYVDNSTVNSNGDVTLPAPNTTSTNLGNTTNWYSNFGLGDTLGLAISNIVYTSGEGNGTTAVFNGFQDIVRTNFSNGAGTDPLDFLVHTGSVGSTTVSTSGTNSLEFDLTSAGTSNTVFITNTPANDPSNGGIRLRDLDLQFETVPAVVPEPTSFVVLLGGLSMMVVRRRRS